MILTRPSFVSSKLDKAPGEFVGVQYLRGIAAIMVIVFHLEPHLRRMNYTGAWVPGMMGGVDIFFVISGMIMWLTTCNRRLTPAQFWRRRITRIVPLYWAVTSFVVLMMFAAPRALQSTRFDLYHVVTSYFFVASRHPIFDAMEPVIIPGWTLNYEMFFYLIFGALLVFERQRRFWYTALLFTILSAIGFLLRPTAATVASFYTSSIILEFVAGMALGVAVMQRGLFSHVGAKLGWTMLAFALICIIVLPQTMAAIPRVVTMGIPATVVVGAVMCIEAAAATPRLPLLHRLGNASYSTYLSHVVVIAAVSQAWHKMHLERLPGGLILFGVVAVASCIAGGFICFHFVEKPLIRLFRTRPARAVSKELPVWVASRE